MPSLDIEILRIVEITDLVVGGLRNGIRTASAEVSAGQFIASVPRMGAPKIVLVELEVTSGRLGNIGQVKVAFERNRDRPSAGEQPSTLITLVPVHCKAPRGVPLSIRSARGEKVNWLAACRINRDKARLAAAANKEKRLAVIR